jgi:DNA-directed RNA polymerase specialized sigma24 family protein
MGEHAMSEDERMPAELRPVSFAIAYRMLGSVAEAEDVVQESLLRVHQALEAGERIQSPRAFVSTITTRLAINELRSARARYVGEWLRSRSSPTARTIPPATPRPPTRSRSRCWSCSRASCRSSVPSS